VEASGEGALLYAAVREEENDGRRREVGFIGAKAGRSSRGEIAADACGAATSDDATLHGTLKQGREGTDEWGSSNLKFNMNSNSEPI
jgi:hypothetical protein